MALGLAPSPYNTWPVQNSPVIDFQNTIAVLNVHKSAHANSWHNNGELEYTLHLNVTPFK
jgi:hypothetical protein